MAVLAELKCTICKTNDIPLDREEIAMLHDDIPDWEVIREDGIDKLKRTFKFKDFRSALDFTNDGRRGEPRRRPPSPHHPHLGQGDRIMVDAQDRRAARK